MLLLASSAAVGYDDGGTAAQTIAVGAPQGGASFVPMGAQASDPERLLPFERVGATTVMDGRSGSLVTFGGWNGDRYFGDVWVLYPSSQNEHWERLTPQGAAPAPRAWHSAVYDPENGRMIVFGGQDRLGRRSDVWALDLVRSGGAWYEVEVEGEPPEPRRMHSAVYDAPNERVIVYGGTTAGGASPEVWSLSLDRFDEAWSRIDPSGDAPAARYSHAAVYDPAGERMVVHGGMYGSGRLGGEGGGKDLVAAGDDVWSLSLAPGAETWSRLAPSGSAPSPRSGHPAAWVEEPGPGMLVLGGEVADGFDRAVWHLGLDPEPIWSVIEPTGGGPAPRAWGSLVYETFGGRAFAFGGGGPAIPHGEHWCLYLRSAPEWRDFSPKVTTNARPGFDVRLEVEDAAPHVPVNVVGGFGDRGETYLYASAHVAAVQAADARDVTVVLTVEDSAFGTTVDFGQKQSAAADPSQWSRAAAIGGGRFRATGVTLEEAGAGQYRRTVVFRLQVPLSAAARDVAVTVEACSATACDDDEGAVRVVSEPDVVVLTNRRALFAAYDSDEVVDLLRTTYNTVRGPVDEAPPGVVVYADRYVPEARTWDNTAVNYASPTAANRAAAAIDAWVDGALAGRTPSNVLIVGDDGIMPFYRQRDADAAAYRHDPDREADHPDVSTLDPVTGAAVRNGYFLTDGPYGRFDGGDDWQVGEVDAAVGRIVGSTAGDVERFLEAGSLGPNPSASRFVTASAADLALERAGPANDVLGAAAALGYDHTPDLVASDPDKTAITSAMGGETAVVVAATRGEAGGLLAPGGPGASWSDPWIVGQEVPEYDEGAWMAANRPFYHLIASRTGLGLTGDGPYGSLLYALVHHGAAAVISSAGLSHSPTPPGGALGPDQALGMAVWEQMIDDVSSTRSIGEALARSKATYDLGWDAEDRKTVQAYTLYGVPWSRLRPHTTAGAGAMASAAGTTVSVTGLRPEQAGPTYAVTVTVDASSFAVTPVGGGYDLLRVEGMRQHADKGEPILPQGVVDFALPLTATVLTATVTPQNAVEVRDVSLPSLATASSHPDARESVYVSTAPGVYPATSSRLEVSQLDTYRLARVLFRPVVYDADADVATVHRSLAVRLEYSAPVPIAVTKFGAGRRTYVPGEQIESVAEVRNASDERVVLAPSVRLLDLGRRVLEATDPVTVELGAGETRELRFSLPATGADDAFALELAVRDAATGAQLAAARDVVQLEWGAIESLEAPERVPIGETARFALTVTNHLRREANAVVGMSVGLRQGGLAIALPRQLATLAPGETRTFQFDWTPPADVGGVADVGASAEIDGQVLGPESRRLFVESRAMNAIWLPIARRGD